MKSINIKETEIIEFNKSYIILYNKILKELETLFTEKNNLNEIIKDVLKAPLKNTQNHISN